MNGVGERVTLPHSMYFSIWMCACVFVCLAHSVRQVISWCAQIIRLILLMFINWCLFAICLTIHFACYSISSGIKNFAQYVIDLCALFIAHSPLFFSKYQISSQNKCKRHTSDFPVFFFFASIEYNRIFMLISIINIQMSIILKLYQYYINKQKKVLSLEMWSLFDSVESLSVGSRANGALRC